MVPSMLRVNRFIRIIFAGGPDGLKPKNSKLNNLSKRFYKVTGLLSALPAKSQKTIAIELIGLSI
jgi:hypothetical protein